MQSKLGYKFHFVILTISSVPHQECSLTVLEECLGLGTQRTLLSARATKEAMTAHAADAPFPPQNSPSREKALDPLLQAAQLTLLRHINNLINMLPVPHQLIAYHVDNTTSQEMEHYREKFEDFFSDSSWVDAVFQLCGTLLRYLACLPMLPWQPAVPRESAKDIARFCVLCSEVRFSCQFYFRVRV